MILHGKNLIIYSDGVAVASSKSCSIEVSAKTIPTASTTDGGWETSIPGRKSWQVTTNHMVISMVGMLMKVGSTVTLKMEATHTDADATPFDGFVDNVTVQTTGLSNAPAAVYWDTTRKCFVALSRELVERYYLTWLNDDDYQSPTDGKAYTANNVTYVIFDGDLVDDVLEGTAICKSARINAQKGDLCTGTWVWEGSGPLAAPATE